MSGTVGRVDSQRHGVANGPLSLAAFEELTDLPFQLKKGYILS
jgi:hypothetical protein